MKVADFKLQFNNFELKKNILAIQFSIAIQSNNKELESYCLEKYPDLMIASEYSMEQLKRLYEMKRYIKSKVNSSSLYSDGIRNYYHANHWIDPLDEKDGIEKLEFTDFDCKKWNDVEGIPHIEIDGKILIDLEKTFNTYLKKKFIQLSLETGLFKRDIAIKFSKPFPLILMYSLASTFNNWKDAYIKQQISQPLNKVGMLGKEIAKLADMDKFHQVQKTINQFDSKTIKIEINEFSKLVEKKIKDNPFASIIAAGLIYKKVKEAKGEVPTVSAFTKATAKEVLKYKTFGPTIYGLSKLHDLTKNKKK